MENTIETMKFVADLARSEGRKEERVSALEAENMRLRKELAAREEIIKMQNCRIQELESMVELQGAQRVVVQRFFVLSMPKTVDYVSSLNNNERRFVGHLFHHTLIDGTPVSVIEQVDEMTCLEGSHTKQLAESLEKVASRETVNVGGDLVLEKNVDTQKDNQS